MSGGGTTQMRRPGGEAIALVVVALAAIALAWFLTRDKEIPLPRSAMGHDGVVTWLKSEGIEARYATGAGVQASTIGLRILPVLDTDLDTGFVRPETREEYLKTGTEIDLFYWDEDNNKTILTEKTRLIPSLVIAPKWTRAARHSGYAHPSLLLPADQPANVLRSLDIFDGDIIRSEAQLRDYPAQIGSFNGDLTLYAPQLLPSNLKQGCEALISSREGVLLAKCTRDETTFHVLSDPDLMNNHGLAIGQNAAFASALVKTLTREGPVLLDTYPYTFAYLDRSEPYRRNWADLLRLFAWPFSLVWFGFGLLTLLALWRSWVRFGPPKKIFDDSLSAARNVSIAAKARILRMTGNDARLFETHVNGRIRMLASELAGPHANATDPLRQITELLSRRDSQSGQDFAKAAYAALAATNDTPQQQLVTLLENFEREAERVLHEFGRV